MTCKINKIRKVQKKTMSCIMAPTCQIQVILHACKQGIAEIV